MSEPYSRFYALINTYGLGQYWDQVEHELDTKGLSRGLSTMSSGERHMARFFASVWLKYEVPDALRFDAVEAAQVLDARCLAIVGNWVRDPWWP